MPEDRIATEKVPGVLTLDAKIVGVHHCFPGESNRHDPTQSVARPARPCTPCEGLTISGGVSVPKVRLSTVARCGQGIDAFKFYRRSASPWTLVMQRLIQVTAVFAVIASLGACAEFPDYKPTPSTSLASISLSPGMATETLYMCESRHDCYELVPSNGAILVPMNQRISLYRKFQGRAYGREGFCLPGISFEPKDRQDYFAVFSVVGNQCMLRIYRLSAGYARPGPFQFRSTGMDLSSYATYDPTMRAAPPLYH